MSTLTLLTALVILNTTSLMGNSAVQMYMSQFIVKEVKKNDRY